MSIVSTVGYTVCSTLLAEFIGFKTLLPLLALFFLLLSLSLLLLFLGRVSKALQGRRGEEG